MIQWILSWFKPKPPVVVACPACGNQNPALLDDKKDKIVCTAKLEDNDLCAFEWTHK